MDNNTLTFIADQKKLNFLSSNEKLDRKYWRGCDNCCQHSKDCFMEQDVTVAALDIINIVTNLQIKRKKSYDTVLKVFRGSQAKDIKDIGADRLNCYGKGKEFTICDTRRLITKLLSMNILNEIVTATQFGGNSSTMVLGTKSSQ
eukprot:298666_1